MRILVVGASGHARVVIDVLEKEGRHEIVGLLDGRMAPGEKMLGHLVLGRDTEVGAIAEAHGVEGYFVAIGDNATRAKVIARVEEAAPRLSLIRAIHPDAVLGKEVEIGAGSVLMAGVVVNPCARVGRGVILNTGSCLDHDAEMGELSSLAPRAVTGGNVRIGRFSAIGIGACIRHGVSIGEEVVIGAGAAVLEDVPSHSVAFGTPAKVVRRRAHGDPYL